MRCKTIVPDLESSPTMEDQQEIQADPEPVNNARGSETSHNVGATGPVETPATSAESVDSIQAGLWCSCSRKESAELGEFLFRNTLSIAKKLFMLVLDSAVNNSSYNDIERIQLSGEMARLMEQNDIDGLVQGWKDKKAAGHDIGLLDGVPVFGPRRVEDEAGITLAPTSYVSLGGIQAMQRLAKREEETSRN